MWFRAAPQRRASSTSPRTASPTLSWPVTSPEVRDGVTGALSVVDPQPPAGTDQLPTVADLPAALGIEGRAIEHDRRG